MLNTIIKDKRLNHKPLRGGDELTASGSTEAGDATAHLHLSGACVLDDNLRPRYGAIKDAWGHFIEQLGNELDGWDWFMTMSFRDPDEHQRNISPTWTKPGWDYAQRGLTNFIKALCKDKTPEQKPYYIAMMEMQRERGVPHWHLLVGNCDDRRMDWVDWCYERYGITRILEYDPKLGAKYYLGKYLTKEMGDVRYSPRLRAGYRGAVA